MEHRRQLRQKDEEQRTQGGDIDGKRQVRTTRAGTDADCTTQSQRHSHTEQCLTRANSAGTATGNITANPEAHHRGHAGGQVSRAAANIEHCGDCVRCSAEASRRQQSERERAKDDSAEASRDTRSVQKEQQSSTERQQPKTKGQRDREGRSDCEKSTAQKRREGRTQQDRR